MTLQQELKSWRAPQQLDLGPVPRPGDWAPSTEQLSMPARTFLALRDVADVNPSVCCVAVSHSNKQSTDKWLSDLNGPGDVQVVVDDKRSLYAKWGLGVSSWMHLANPANFINVYRLGKDAGIKVRSTESGSRWQTSGAYAVDGDGVVRWGGPAKRSDEFVRFDEALKALKSKESKL
ncbi:MAG: hypothetical protein Q9159_006238 [Coniocarpon cinnabarinum]